MRKRVLSAVLAGIMTASLFVGCGGSDSARDSGGAGVKDTAGTETAEAKKASGDKEHIIMTYLTIGTTPSDLQAVQDAVNEISVPKINVEIELKPVSIAETMSGTYSMWIGSGEQIDLMNVAFSGLNDYVSSGQINRLNDLITEKAPYLTKISEEFSIYDGATVDGETYGVAPVMPCYGFRGGMVVREDYFNETGIKYKDQYTLEEMTSIMAAIKEAHPDSYPCCLLGNRVNNSQTTYGFFGEMDALGATMKSGVLNDSQSTNIVNIFETEEYHDFLLMMRDWNEKGYIMPDAATTDSASTELLASGKCSTLPMNLQPVQLTGTESAYGWNSVGLNMTDGYCPATTPSSGTYWTVPVTSKNPEAAVTFMNLMYENQDVADLLKSGIEGTHYVKADEDYVIAFPEGMTIDNATYYQPLGLFGDRRYELLFSKGSSLAENEAWTENNMKKKYKSVGYSYNETAMTNQLIAIGTVLDQYLPSLETGSVADVEETYKDMLAALKAAGIDEVIVDNQKQFDVWLADNK